VVREEDGRWSINLDEFLGGGSRFPFSSFSLAVLYTVPASGSPDSPLGLWSLSGQNHQNKKTCFDQLMQDDWFSAITSAEDKHERDHDNNNDHVLLPLPFLSPLALSDREPNHPLKRETKKGVIKGIARDQSLSSGRGWKRWRDARKKIKRTSYFVKPLNRRVSSIDHRTKRGSGHTGHMNDRDRLYHRSPPDVDFNS